MAIARTGVFVDDYLEYSSTLPAELQRLLNTMRELDERSQGIKNEMADAILDFAMTYDLLIANILFQKKDEHWITFKTMINQTREQTNYCLGLSSQSSKRGNNEDDEATFEKLRKEIETNQENTLSLCTEKVLLARQAYDLGPGRGIHIDSHVKRLDEDLNQFAEDLKQEGKISPDEPAILPPMPIIPKDEKRKSFFGTPQPKRLTFRERDWDRESDRDFELMPPPGSHKKGVPAHVDVDQLTDPNEPTYCVCHQVSFGDMIACDNENVMTEGHYAKEENGSTIRAWGSHQRQDSRESGIVQPADRFYPDLNFRCRCFSVDCYRPSKWMGIVVILLAWIPVKPHNSTLDVQ
ncbi:PHD finger protein ing2 [Asimina triloba]